METVDLSISALAVTFLLLAVPVFVSLHFRFGLIKPLAYAVARMTIQLMLIGIFLKYLFTWNNPALNLLWLMIMISVAVYSAVRDSAMKMTKIALPTFISFLLATFGVILYLNTMVIRLDTIFDAKYLIVLGGMLLGNSLRGNIVGITTFYTRIRNDKKLYLYRLSLGATRQEALRPYLKESIQLALKPTLAAMATMGIVALPGMMTGAILGGARPDVAIKYQIMIMIAIVVSTLTSVLLAIVLSSRVCFNRYGILHQDIFVG